jgi:hypothetical protein
LTKIEIENLQGAIQRPNRHQLGKIAMLYLGGIWKEDQKRREALAAQQNQELEKQRSPITRPTTQPRRDNIGNQNSKRHIYLTPGD